jgi:cell division protein FtsB
MKRIRIVLKQTLFLAIIIGSIVTIVRFSFSIYDLWSRKDIVNEKKLEYERVRKEQDQLKQDRDWVKSQEYVEKEARETLGLGKEGETVILFGKQEEKSGSNDGASSQDRVWEDSKTNVSYQSPLWKAWVALFF